MLLSVEFLEAIPAEQHPIILLLDAVILHAAPSLTVSLKWGNLTYAGKKNVCSIILHKHHVNLQFFDGASLQDPRGLLIGSGKKMRHIKIVSETDIDTKYIAELVKQAEHIR